MATRETVVGTTKEPGKKAEVTHVRKEGIPSFTRNRAIMKENIAINKPQERRNDNRRRSDKKLRDQPSTKEPVSRWGKLTSRDAMRCNEETCGCCGIISPPLFPF